MYYEINVSKNGKHYFATAERSLRDEDEARAAYFDFCERFPSSDGFSITVTRWESYGKVIRFDEESSKDLYRATGMPGVGKSAVIE